MPRKKFLGGNSKTVIIYIYQTDGKSRQFRLNYLLRYVVIGKKGCRVALVNVSWRLRFAHLARIFETLLIVTLRGLVWAVIPIAEFS